MKRLFIIMALVAMTSLAGNAQDDCYDCYVKNYEKVLGTHYASFEGTFYPKTSDYYHMNYGYTKQEIYIILLNRAKSIYPNRSNLKIRGASLEETSHREKDRKGNTISKTYYYTCTYSVVVEDPQAKTEALALRKLERAVNKALTNIPSGARMAFDNITVPNSLNSDDFKDQLLDILVDKGYRVVAKEYLQRLLQEQDDWDSGFYNDTTTGQTRKFSAVGYFINLKVTESSIRVQVIDVITGEYVGNATVNF